VAIPDAKILVGAMFYGGIYSMGAEIG